RAPCRGRACVFLFCLSSSLLLFACHLRHFDLGFCGSLGQCFRRGFGGGLGRFFLVGCGFWLWSGGFFFRLFPLCRWFFPPWGLWRLFLLGPWALSRPWSSYRPWPRVP